MWCFPLRYYRKPSGFGDRHTYAQLTRFITAEVRRCFETRTSGVTAESESTVPVIAEPVGDRLRRLWAGRRQTPPLSR
jgi:hypothetical protein